MQVKSLVALALTAVLSFSTSLPVLAEATLSSESIDRIKTLRADELSRLLLHKTPKAPVKLPFKDADDQDVTIDAFKGKIVLLNFWATWCPPCREEMPSLDRLQAALGGDDFQVLPVSLDRQGTAKIVPFFDKIQAKQLPIYIDAKNKYARANGAIGLPMTLILDREGREIGRYAGPAEWDSPSAISILKAIIAETSNNS